MPEQNAAIPVALARWTAYDSPGLDKLCGEILDAAEIRISANDRILVKPNLLMAHPLACTSPDIVAGVCKWLLDNGAKITVSDSPAFGTARSVARSIGLDADLKRIGLEVSNFSRSIIQNVPMPDGDTVSIRTAALALECDQIISVPRVKAHSQMRITLATKNCFGCILGVSKAFAHVRFGKSLEYFSDFVASFWHMLPHVSGFIDGVIAMNNTGPRNGQPFNLGIMGASASTVALDQAILEILQIPAAEIPLARALERRGAIPAISFPLLQPRDMATSGFHVPQKLKAISFSPSVLFKSLVRRIWYGFGLGYGK